MTDAHINETKFFAQALTAVSCGMLVNVNKGIYGLLPLGFDPENRAGSSYAVQLEEHVKSRLVELTYTAWDLEPFARGVGFDGPPFRWDA